MRLLSKGYCASTTENVEEPIFTVNGNAEIEANVTADGGIDLDKTLLTGAGITFDTDDGGGTDVVISGTLDSEATEANGLTIAAGAANVTFGGVVGMSAASNLRLGNLTVTANVLNLNNVFTNGNIADGNVDFSAVTTTELGGSDRTIDTAGGDVNIGGTIQSTGGNGITINTIADTAATAGGDVTLNDFATPGNVVGFLTVIADAVSATGITVNQDITAGGNVDIDAEGNFLLTGGDTISAGGTGTINILSQNGSANITGFLVTADGNIDVSANADITSRPAPSSPGRAAISTFSPTTAISATRASLLSSMRSVSRPLWAISKTAASKSLPPPVPPSGPPRESVPPTRLIPNSSTRVCPAAGWLRRQLPAASVSPM